MVAWIRVQDTEEKQGKMEEGTAESGLFMQQGDKDCTRDNRSFLKSQSPLP